MNILLQSWYDSILLLKPSNLSLFILVTLNNLKRSYYYLLYYFWWLSVIEIITFQSLLNQPLFIFSETDQVVSMGIERIQVITIGIWILVLLLWIFVIYLCMRPSVMPKNIAYFLQYKIYFFYFIIGLLLKFFIDLWLLFFIKIVPLLSVLLGFLQSVFLLFPFFLLDSSASFMNILYSIVRAFMMIWYNLPFILLLFFVLAVPWGLSFLFIVQQHNSIWWQLLILIGIPLYVAFFNTLYVKKVHEQFNVYFKQ